MGPEIEALWDLIRREQETSRPDHPASLMRQASLHMKLADLLMWRSLDLARRTTASPDETKRTPGG